MWQATVRADQSVKVGIEPESAWPLLTAPQAWSGRLEDSMIFDLGSPLGLTGEKAPDQDRLYFWFLTTNGRANAVVLEVTTDASSQTIGIQSQGGRIAWVLSAQPWRAGTQFRIRATWTVERPLKVHAEAELRAQVKRWLSALRQSANDRSPQPDSMPERLRRACLATPPDPAVEVSASTVIDAPPDIVQRVHRSSELARLIAPENVRFLGRVPATPDEGNVGSMRYVVSRRTDGLLAGRVSLLMASSPGGSVRRYVTPPFAEVTNRYEPAGAGTRLEIFWRCYAKHALGPEAHREKHAARLTAQIGQLKTAIESLAAPGRQSGSD